MSRSTRETRVWGDQIREDRVPEKWVKPSAQVVAQHEDLYELAYDQGLRALDDQLDELNNARTRSVQFLALASAATAFLAGAVINGAGDRTITFYLLGVVGTVLALSAIFCVGYLLNPRSTRLHARMDPRVIIEGYIERDVPVPNKAELLRELSLSLSNWEADNSTLLARVRAFYFASVVLGGFQVVAWTALTWVAR